MVKNKTINLNFKNNKKRITDKDENKITYFLCSSNNFKYKFLKICKLIYPH